MSKSHWLDAEKVDEEVRKDPQLSRVIQDLEQDSNSHKHYPLQNGRLFCKGRLVLAANSVWIPFHYYFRNFIQPQLEDIQEPIEPIGG